MPKPIFTLVKPNKPPFPVHSHPTHPSRPITKMSFVNFPGPFCPVHPQPEVPSLYGLPIRTGWWQDSVVPSMALVNFWWLLHVSASPAVSKLREGNIHSWCLCGPKIQNYPVCKLLCIKDGKKQRVRTAEIKKTQHIVHSASKSFLGHSLFWPHSWPLNNTACTAQVHLHTDSFSVNTQADPCAQVSHVQIQPTPYAEGWLRSYLDFWLQWVWGGMWGGRAPNTPVGQGSTARASFQRSVSCRRATAAERALIIFLPHTDTTLTSFCRFFHKWDAPDPRLQVLLEHHNF